MRRRLTPRSHSVLGRGLDVRTAALAVATLLVAVAWASYGTGMRAGVATDARLVDSTSIAEDISGLRGTCA